MVNISKTYEELKDLLKEKNFQKRIDSLAKKYKDKKIIIYGAGMVFNVIADNYDLSKLNIIGISDKKITNEEEIRGYKAITPFDVQDYNPDVLLIAVYMPFQVKDFLLNEVLTDSKNVRLEPFIKKNFKESLEEFLYKIYCSI